MIPAYVQFAVIAQSLAIIMLFWLTSRLHRRNKELEKIIENMATTWTKPPLAQMEIGHHIENLHVFTNKATQ